VFGGSNGKTGDGLELGMDKFKESQRSRGTIQPCGWCDSLKNGQRPDKDIPLHLANVEIASGLMVFPDLQKP
jgi:hypothetical protein